MCVGGGVKGREGGEGKGRGTNKVLGRLREGASGDGGEFEVGLNGRGEGVGVERRGDVWRRAATGGRKGWLEVGRTVVVVAMRGRWVGEWKCWRKGDVRMCGRGMQGRDRRKRSSEGEEGRVTQT
jgi:hypothetical protein